MMNSNKILLERAHKAREQAYAPYSNFRVGAALLCEDGTVIEGCNVENASYGLSICAERNAIAAAIMQGHRRFKTIAVLTDMDTPCAPCGACRQVLAEFAPNLPVIMSNIGGQVEETTLGELLPRQFKLLN